jgi:hypothetical protein
VSVPTASAKKWTLKRDDDVAPSIFNTVMTKLGFSHKRICREGTVQFREGFFFLRHLSQFGRLRAQETIQETRSGDKSPTLKVDELRDRDCVVERTGVAPRALWWGVWDCGVECV